MTRTSIFACSALAVTLAVVAGCDKASDEQQKANAAQSEADKKIAEANKEATTKTTGAQVEADQKIASAEAEFGKRRENYRHEIQSELVELDKKIDVLEAKAKTATAKGKTDLNERLTQIRAQRSAFAADLSSAETSTATQWDSMKARVDKNLTDLRTTIDKAL